MPKYIGDKLLKARYVGDKVVTKIYHGASLVWGAIQEVLVSLNGKILTFVNGTREESVNNFKLYGKSEQNQYQGTNISKLDMSKNTQASAFDYEIVENGNIKATCINQTKGGRFYAAYTMNVEANESYTFSFDYANLNLSGVTTTDVVMYGYRDNLWGTTISGWVDAAIYGTRTLVSPISGSIVIGLYVTTSSGDTIEVRNFRVNKGIKKDYEPYVGGIPSPSPEYPQEIKNVDNPVVTFDGKNLIDFKKVKPNGWDTPSLQYEKDDKGFTMSYYPPSIDNYRARRIAVFPCDIKKGKRYVINCKKIDRGNMTELKAYSFGDTTQYYPVGTGFIANNDYGVIAIYVDGNKYVEGLDTYIYDIQLEESGVATEYEPYYEPQTHQFPYTLYGIPVQSGGNYTDESGQQWIGDYVDIENKKLWRYCVRERIEGVDHLQSINQYGIANFFINKIYDYLMSELSGKIFMCNKFSMQYSLIADTKDEGLLINTTGSSYIRISSDKVSTVAQMNDYLTNNDAYLIGALVTPTSINLTDAEVEAFKGLKTHKGTTIISNDYEAHMYGSYHTKLEELDVAMTNEYNRIIKEITE